MTDQIQQSPSTDSTDSIAMILEIIFGLFGGLGMGWLYVGSYGTAALMFFGYLVLFSIEAFFVVITGGLLACITLPVNIAIAIISGIRVRDHVRTSGAQGACLNVVIAFALFLVVLFVLGGLIFLPFLRGYY